MVPADFGELGHYRTGAVPDNMARPIVYAGQAVCVECHADVAELRAKGKHVRVACESCHGALAAHASNPDGQKPVRPIPQDVHQLAIRRTSRSRSPSAGRAEEHAPEGSCAACHAVHNRRSPDEPNHGPGPTDIPRPDRQAARPHGFGRHRMGARAGGPTGRGAELQGHRPLVGMAVDIEKCIGCGTCVRACKTENDVPHEAFTFRTWVERYVVDPADYEHRR